MDHTSQPHTPEALREMVPECFQAATQSVNSLYGYDFSCPSTGQPCLIQQDLIKRYVRSIELKQMNQLQAGWQRLKLSAKLIEYSLDGSFIDCQPTGPCAVRQSMNRNSFRLNGVRIFRLLRKGLVNLGGAMKDLDDIA